MAFFSKLLSFLALSLTQASATSPKLLWVSQNDDYSLAEQISETGYFSPVKVLWMPTSQKTGKDAYEKLPRIRFTFR
jgi:hypothetical protein